MSFSYPSFVNRSAFICSVALLNRCCLVARIYSSPIVTHYEIKGDKRREINIQKFFISAIILAMSIRTEVDPMQYPFDAHSGSNHRLLPSPDIILLPQGGVIRPKDRLIEQAQSMKRSIENCWWARAIQLDFDVPKGVELSPANQRFKDQLTESLGRQIIKGKKHGIPSVPSETSDMIVGFFDIPSGNEALWDRIQEVPPMVMRASKDYGVNAFHKNYTIVVNTPEALTKLKKRDMEQLVRRTMGSLGGLKLVFINDQGQMSFATLEGGLGTENISDEDGMDKFRDRMVTHACAVESGSYQFVKSAISAESAGAARMPDYLAGILKNFGDWEYIDGPFEVESVVSPERTALAKKLLGWGRQSESAASAHDLRINAPVDYKMGDVDGLIMSTISGRNDAFLDKRNMGREGSMYVSIVPKNGEASANDPLNLYTFNRFALGIEGVNEKMPSIEFDEMASVYRNSPGFQVEPVFEDGNLVGYRKDENGSLSMKRVRGFVHFHGTIEEIAAAEINGINVLDMVEYIPANLREYPYPVGCGKDIQFGASTDAALRSRGVQDPTSGIHVAFFDAIDHGTHMLVLAEPIPGTDIIPEDPFYMLSQIVNPEHHIVSIIAEIPQI